MKAIVIGATGMVGTELTRVLVQDDNFKEVVLLTRHVSNVNSPKITEHFVDFDDPETWKELVRGDVLFSCMGTTLEKAGSQANQYTVDFTYQYEVAAAAAANGVSTYVLVSSVGADPASMFFYLKMKGKLEQAVRRLPFQKTVILRPAQLYGNRSQPRHSEELALNVTRFLNNIGIMRAKRPVSALQVAMAMARSVHINGSPVLLSNNDIISLAADYLNNTIRQNPNATIPKGKATL